MAYRTEPRGRWRISAGVAKTGAARWVTPPPVLFEAVTALLPRDFFPETPEVGKVCKVRVERLLDEQAEVSYVKDEKKSEPEAPEMEMADAEMAGLME